MKKEDESPLYFFNNIYTQIYLYSDLTSVLYLSIKILYYFLRFYTQIFNSRCKFSEYNTFRLR